MIFWYTIYYVVIQLKIAFIKADTNSKCKWPDNYYVFWQFQTFFLILDVFGAFSPENIYVVIKLNIALIKVGGVGIVIVCILDTFKIKCKNLFLK